MLANILITLPFAIVSEMAGNIVSLILFIPGLAVTVRRLHDLGRSGWWILVAFTIIGIFVLLYWYCQEGERATNRFGDDPKGGTFLPR